MHDHGIPDGDKGILEITQDGLRRFVVSRRGAVAGDLLAIDLERVDHAARVAPMRLFQKVAGATHCRPEPSNRLGQCVEPTIRVDSQRGQLRIVMTLIERNTARGRDQRHVVTGGHPEQRID